MTKQSKICRRTVTKYASNRRQGRNSGRNKSNTRGRVSLAYPNTENRVGNTMQSRVFFDEIQGVWLGDEPLSGVFEYISFQSKQKLKTNSACYL